ncbi:MAG: glucosamine-6-phosphate deaminase [Bacteroidia bacterium]|nr:glucosamine-6-phosphate deaminase [Bacteroidia bacterium]
MLIKTYPDYQALSEAAGLLLYETLRQYPKAVICIASGDTPTGACQVAARLVQENNLDCTQAHFIGLDEWVGIPPSNPGSCQYPVRAHLLTPLGIPETQIHFFDSLAPDLQLECDRMNDTLARLGGLDLMLVGVGVNGHIGLNEPGTPADIRCHISELAESTRTMGQKYFRSATPLTQGITLGLGDCMAARQLVVLANGPRKTDIVREIVHAPVTPAIPATLLRTHPNGWLMLDEVAAARLTEA